MYQLTVSENQLKLINTALEEYFRIGMNQWEDLSDRISKIGIDLDPKNPKHDKIFDSYIEKRDDVRVILQAVGRMLWPFGLQKQSEENIIAQDIWQVIRHQLWIDNPMRDELAYTVDAREPFLQSQEPRVVCVRLPDEPGGQKHGKNR